MCDSPVRRQVCLDHMPTLSTTLIIKIAGDLLCFSFSYYFDSSVDVANLINILFPDAEVFLMQEASRKGEGA